MITDSRKPIDSSYPIIYDRRNLPLSIKIGSSTNTYSYDDAGQRIYKQLSSTNMEFYLIDHTGKELAVYNWYTRKQKMFNLYGNGMIGKVNITYDANNNRTSSRQYYIKDHLGSIRMTIDGASFDVVGAQDYYPFGAIMENRSFTTGGNINDKYKFTEKERDVETNYDYFGARLYDSDLGRWLQLDPLTDKYPGWSPYNYCINNPLGVVDSDGKDYEIIIDHDKKTIVIRAVYYVPDATSRSAIQSAVAQWNSYSGTYTSSDGIEYAVSFNLSVVQDPMAQTSAQNDPAGNYFEASDNKFQFYKNNLKLNKDSHGMTDKYKNIIVPSTIGNDNTKAHEIGHTLMQGHGAGVMQTYVELKRISAVTSNNAENVVNTGINQSIDGSSNNISVKIIGQYKQESFYRSWLNRKIFNDGIKLK